jgi:hypothetical protein
VGFAASDIITSVDISEEEDDDVTGRCNGGELRDDVAAEEDEVLVVELLPNDVVLFTMVATSTG